MRGDSTEKERKERLMEEKYCVICYEPIGSSEPVEIPTPSYEPDKFAHQDCFLTKLEELGDDATKGKMLRYILNSRDCTFR